MEKQEKSSSWVKPVLGVALFGALLVGGIAWLLLGKSGASAPRSVDPSDESGLAPLESSRPYQMPYQSPQGVQQASASQAGYGGAPQAASQGSYAQDSRPQGQDGQQRPRRRQDSSATPLPGAPPAQAAPDSSGQGGGSQSQGQQRQRMSRKERIEKTAPEDRARMAQLRIEERNARGASGSPPPRP